jgi:hypothetical protein
MLLPFLLLVSLTAAAQEIESLAGVRLTFDRPGARSLAMGSTGLAILAADGAATNPASIAGASRSVSIERRRRTMEGRYIASTNLDTIGIQSTTTDIRSASFTVPTGHTTWSFFYDAPLDVNHSTASAFTSGTSAPFFVCDGHVVSSACNATALLLALPATYAIDASLRLQRYGGAAAWSSGPLAVGASVRREHLEQQTAYVPTALGVQPYAGVSETTDDTSMTWSAGLTWNITHAARIGAAYSSGGSFSGTRTFPAPTNAQSLELRTPSSIGAGIAIDALPSLTLSADAVRVDYSEMMHDRRNVFPQASSIGYPDVTELHAGAEYRFGKVAVRGGWWRDPAHALSVQNGITPPPPFHYITAIVDQSENHLTAGLGFGGKTRFDAAIDRSPRSTQISLGVSSTF